MFHSTQVRRVSASIALSSFVLMYPVASIADELVLRDGTKYAGTFANRELVQQNPLVSPEISILIPSDDGTDDQLIRVPIATIDYLVFETPTGRSVVDVQGLQSIPRTRPNRNANARGGREFEDSGRTGGFTLMVLGGMAIALGFIEKFGGPKATITESNFDVDDESYNALNYLLIGVGGAMFLGGIIILGGIHEQEAAGMSSSMQPRVGLRFTF